jgi:hypothetical protein
MDEESADNNMYQNTKILLKQTADYYGQFFFIIIFDFLFFQVVNEKKVVN